MFHCWNH